MTRNENHECYLPNELMRMRLRHWILVFVRFVQFTLIKPSGFTNFHIKSAAQKPYFQAMHDLMEIKLLSTYCGAKTNQC